MLAFSYMLYFAVVAFLTHYNRTLRQTVKYLQTLPPPEPFVEIEVLHAIETVTQSVTDSVTQSVTQSVTKSVTETVTQSVTQTVTLPSVADIPQYTPEASAPTTLLVQTPVVQILQRINDVIERVSARSIEHPNQGWMIIALIVSIILIIVGYDYTRWERSRDVREHISEIKGIEAEVAKLIEIKDLTKDHVNGLSQELEQERSKHETAIEDQYYKLSAKADNLRRSHGGFINRFNVAEKAHGELLKQREQELRKSRQETEDAQNNVRIWEAQVNTPIPDTIDLATHEQEVKDLQSKLFSAAADDAARTENDIKKNEVTVLRRESDKAIRDQTRMVIQADCFGQVSAVPKSQQSEAFQQLPRAIDELRIQHDRIEGAMVNQSGDSSDADETILPNSAVTGSLVQDEKTPANMDLEDILDAVSDPHTDNKPAPTQSVTHNETCIVNERISAIEPATDTETSTTLDDYPVLTDSASGVDSDTGTEPAEILPAFGPATVSKPVLTEDIPSATAADDVVPVPVAAFVSEAEAVPASAPADEAALSIKPAPKINTAAAVTQMGSDTASDDTPSSSDAASTSATASPQRAESRRRTGIPRPPRRQGLVTPAIGGNETGSTVIRRSFLNGVLSEINASETNEAGQRGYPAERKPCAESLEANELLVLGNTAPSTSTPRGPTAMSKDRPFSPAIPGSRATGGYPRAPGPSPPAEGVSRRAIPPPSLLSQLLSEGPVASQSIPLPPSRPQSSGGPVVTPQSIPLPPSRPQPSVGVVVPSSSDSQPKSGIKPPTAGKGKGKGKGKASK